MSGNWIALPLLIALSGALLSLIWPRRLKGRKTAAGVIFLGQFLLSACLLYHVHRFGPLTLAVGGWKAPYGIILALDSFSSIMLASANLIFFCTALFSFGKTASLSDSGHFLRVPLTFFLQAGVALSFSTADFFNLFVAFELMLVSSYALIGLEARADKMKHVFYYIILNMVGSFLFLVIAAMIYGYTGSLNMAELSLRFEQMQGQPMVTAIAVFSLIVYGLKAGLFPFYFWLPDSYPVLPGSIAGLFSAILTKAGIYVLIRLFITVLPPELPWISELILFLAGLTMLLGVLGAMSKRSIKEILCYHILSQAGYMAMALGLFSTAALSAGIFFIIHNMVVKASLILIGGVIGLAYKTDDLEEVSGAAAVLPAASSLFLVQAFSLAGIPPLSGFWGKYLLFYEGVRLGRYFVVAIAVLTGFFTLFSMIKIWSQAFCGPKKPAKVRSWSGYRRKFAASSILTVAALAMGLGAQSILLLTDKAAEQLFHRKEYVEAVLAAKGDK